jgi:hypothetical protein
MPKLGYPKHFRGHRFNTSHARIDFEFALYFTFRITSARKVNSVHVHNFSDSIQVLLRHRRVMTLAAARYSGGSHMVIRGYRERYR